MKTLTCDPRTPQPSHTLNWRDRDFMVTGLNEHGEEFGVICRSIAKAWTSAHKLRTEYRFKSIRIRLAERNNGFTHWSKVGL